MNYMKLETCNLVNGEGARVVLWVAGCSHYCDGCHNIETWNPNAGYKFTNDTLNKLLEYLSDKYIDGLTISGGDPLFDDNFEEVLEICKAVKKEFPQKNIWLWTGFTLKQLIDTNKDEIFQYIDYLIDGKYEKDKPTSKKYRGSDNQVRYGFKDGKYYFID